MNGMTRGYFGFIECTGPVSHKLGMPSLCYFQKLPRINVTTTSGSLPDPSKQQADCAGWPRLVTKCTGGCSQLFSRSRRSSSWVPCGSRNTGPAALRERKIKQGRRVGDSETSSLSLSLSFKERAVGEREKQKVIQSGGGERRKPLQGPSKHNVCHQCKPNVEPTWAAWPDIGPAWGLRQLSINSYVGAFKYCSPLKCFLSFAQTGTLAPDQWREPAGGTTRKASTRDSSAISASRKCLTY